VLFGAAGTQKSPDFDQHIIEISPNAFLGAWFLHSQAMASTELRAVTQGLDFSKRNGTSRNM